MAALEHRVAVSKPCLYQLNAVTKSYGGCPVLHIERFEIVTGEMLLLVGPTGAGKSTLLRLLTGLEAPTSGQVRFGPYYLGGRNVPLEVLRRITMVFQRPLLLDGTVKANVEYGLRLRGRRRSSVRGEAVLDSLHLQGLTSRRVRALSGGETQLSALARAPFLSPEVLLLD